MKSGGIPARKLGEADKTKDKDAKAKEAAEMNLLFRPVTTQKVEKGTFCPFNIMIQHVDLLCSLVFFFQVLTPNLLCAHFISKVNVPRVISVNFPMTWPWKERERSALSMLT